MSFLMEQGEEWGKTISSQPFRAAVTAIPPQSINDCKAKFNKDEEQRV